jgi:hypothetical protein
VGTAQRDAAWRQIFPRSNFQNGFNSGPQSQLPLSTFQQQRLQSHFNTAPGTISRGASGFDRTVSGTATGNLQSTGGNRPTQFSNVNRTSGTVQNHVFAQRSTDWQPTWDRNCDHWWNGHRCRFVNNSWIIFDLGFYPWWSYGYGYPYDYGYGYDYYPYGSGYDPRYYGDGQYYSQDQYYGDGQYYGQDGYGSSDQYGDSPVAAAQERLAREGYYRGRIDGVFSPETRRALMAFQRDHGLNATGYLTRDTRHALGLRP